MSQKRSQARRHAVQALYQWQIAGQDVADIVNQFLEEQSLESFEVPYFQDLVITSYSIHYTKLYDDRASPQNLFMAQAAALGKYSAALWKTTRMCLCRSRHWSGTTR